MAACSSGTTSVPMSEKFLFLRSSLTAGPERSTRSPRAQESLTVRTAAVSPSGVEEDIFFFLLLWCFATVALGFVELAQAFHEQALSIEFGGLLLGLAFEIDFEISVGPAQEFEHGRISHQGAVGRVGYLAFAEEELAFIVFVGEGE